MALCSTGSMSLGGSTDGRSVNCELGRSGTGCISMGESDVRDLAGVSSGAISLSDFFGASANPETLGESFEGGFYMGTITTAGTTYSILVAPNATGCASCTFQPSNQSSPGACSETDGFANTYNGLANSSHPAGNWTATRTISGFSDWYLPANQELRLIYSNQGALPSGEEYALATYWTSTESAYLSGSLACYVNFSNGRCYQAFKQAQLPIRAGRRVPI